MSAACKQQAVGMMRAFLACNANLLQGRIGATSSILGHVQVPWAAVQHHFQHQPIQHISTAASSGKNLDDIMKVERLQGKTADDVEQIWMGHHESSSSHIATVMSAEEHAVLSARAAASPLFVLPLAKPPRGFQTLLLQWQPPKQALFTTLEQYKQHGANATPHLVVQMYDDVAASHGLVLVRGDVVNPQLINAAEGRTLLELARAFYTDPTAYQMVYAFNHQPDLFSFQQLCRELGVMGAGTSQPGGM